MKSIFGTISVLTALAVSYAAYGDVMTAEEAKAEFLKHLGIGQYMGQGCNVQVEQNGDYFAVYVDDNNDVHQIELNTKADWEKPDVAVTADSVTITTSEADGDEVLGWFLYIQSVSVVHGEGGSLTVTGSTAYDYDDPDVEDTIEEIECEVLFL